MSPEGAGLGLSWVCLGSGSTTGANILSHLVNCKQAAPDAAVPKMGRDVIGNYLGSLLRLKAGLRVEGMVTLLACLCVSVSPSTKKEVLRSLGASLPFNYTLHGVPNQTISWL